MEWTLGLRGEMLDMGPAEGEAQALPGAGEGGPSGLGHQLCVLLPNGPGGFICTSIPGTFRQP